MAPATFEHPLTTTLTSTMNFQAMLAAHFATSASAKKPTASSSTFKTLYVGKDQHHISISNLDAVSAPAWKKSAAFNHLSNALTRPSSTLTMSPILSPSCLKNFPSTPGLPFRKPSRTQSRK